MYCAKKKKKIMSKQIIDKSSIPIISSLSTDVTLLSPSFSKEISFKIGWAKEVHPT